MSIYGFPRWHHHCACCSKSKSTIHNTPGNQTSFFRMHCDLEDFNSVNRVGVRSGEDLIVWRQHYIYVMHNKHFYNSFEFSCSRQLSWPISFFCAHAIKFSPSKQYCLALVAPRGDHKLDVATFLCGFNCHIIIYCHCVNAFAFYIFLNECIVSGGG